MIPMRPAALAPAVLVLAACGGGGGGATPRPPAPPLVVDSVDPPDGSENVGVNRNILVTFATAMDPAPLEGGALVLALEGSGAPVDATVVVSPARTSALIDPLVPLLGDRAYQVRLSGLARPARGREIRDPWHSEFRTETGGPPPPPPPPAQGGTVSATGNMGVGRSGHAAVSLADGRVAVFGGFDTSSSVTASVETYDPSAGIWTAGGPLGTARARCSATLLDDGRVLVAGGETASTTDVGLGTYEIWDPATRAVVATGNLAERRTRHRAVKLGDGRVLLAGGSRTDSPGAPNFSRTSAEVFEAATGICSPVSAMSVPRAGHEATLLADGRVLVTGGHGTSVVTEVFDPATSSFTGAGSMTEARRDHTATLLGDGSVLVAGGGNSSADRWVPGSFTYFKMQNLGDVRSLATAVRVGNGRVMVVGGEKPVAGGGVFYHSSMDFYDPPSGNFLFPNLVTRVPRSGHTATLLPGGDVLLAGGKNTIAGPPAVRSCDRVRPQ